MKENAKTSAIRYAYKLILAFTIMLTIFCSRKDELQKGIKAIEKGDYAAAVKSLQSALKSDSLNPEVHFSLSLSYAHLDSVQASFVHYLKLVELDTTSKFKNDVPLREMLATFLKIAPYAWKAIPMKWMNQFKGALSPDGKTIAIAAAKRDRANIYLTKLNGKVIRKITSSGMNTDPYFSPAGDQIIFVSDADGDDELYTYDMETKKVKQITDNSAQDFSPAYSPDGKEVVFVSNMDDPNKWEIYKVNIENKKIKRLTKNNYWDGFPKFSSDGKSIVFSSKREGSENIYTIKKHGGSEKMIYESDADDNDPVLIDQTMFFKSNRDGKWEIYRFDLKSKKLFRLTYNSVPDWNPRLSNDGTKIVIARKIKKRWRLYYTDFNNPVAADLLAAKIEKKIAAKK
jgi:Tol biopolymer transport system component